MAKSAFLLLLGLILAGYAVGAPLLGLFGTRATAFVTEVRRCHGERNESVRNRYDYSVGYYFIAPGGQRVDGGTTVVGNAYSSGIAKGPTPVYYLAAWPRINLLARETGLGLDKLILLAVGAALMVIAVKKSKSTGKNK